MKIEVFMLAWNRAETIAFSIRHYQKFCEKITILDNFSDDATRDIAYSMGCEVQLFGREGILDDQAYKDLKNNVWKGSEYDWVIIVDDDEIIYESSIRYLLADAKAKRQTIFKTQGIQMHSDSLPTTDWLEITTGSRDDNYSKQGVFNPQEIREINYEYGCHTHCHGGPKGRIEYAPNKLWLLHYNFVGGVERIINRWKEYEPRRQRSQMNIRYNLGHRYAKTESEICEEWADSLRKSRTLPEVFTS